MDTDSGRELNADKEEIPVQPNPIQEEDEEDEEDDEEGMEIEREVDFKFQEFIGRFAQPKVIQACGLALRRFDTNPTFVNHCVLKLLHRIAWDCKMPAMLFQASIFRTFQRIFAEGNDPEYKELVKFAIFVIRQFVEVAEKNKKVFMELLFWKNTKDAYDVEQGYGSYETSSKAMKKAWTEVEENELRVLVMEYKERGIEEDAVDWLMNNLVDNTKSRMQIIRKLKELMLMDYSGRNKKSNVSMRAPKDWNEEEVAQLTQLYDELKDAMDPLSCIMDRLDVKRPKLRVKQKILDLGLADNKALRKKRSTKSRDPSEKEGSFPSRSIIDDEDDSDSDSSSNNEENEDHSNIMNSGQTQRASATKKNKKSSRITKKKPAKTQKLELPALKTIILDLIEKDMMDSLKWISECLTEAAEDQEDDINLDGDEGIPLVPINAKDVNAITNPIFEKFLLGIGIKKPSSEQEKFWRIPGNMPAAELTTHAKFIDEIVEKGVEAFPEYNQQQSSAQPAQESSDDEDVFNRVRNFMSKPTITEDPFFTEEQNDLPSEQFEEIADDVVVEHNLKNGVLADNSTQKSKKKRIIPNASDDSDPEPINEFENNKDDGEAVIENELEDGFLVEKSSSKTKKKRIAVLDESGGSDSEGIRENNSDILVSNEYSEKTKNSRQIVDDSDASDNESAQNVPKDSSNEPESCKELNGNNSRNKEERRSKRVQISSDESDTENTNTNEKVNNTVTKKSRRIMDDSESDPENDSSDLQEKEMSSQKSRSNADENSSDSDDMTQSLDAKRGRESDSESGDTSVKRKKVVIFDSDED